MNANTKNKKPITKTSQKSGCYSSTKPATTQDLAAQAKLAKKTESLAQRAEYEAACAKIHAKQAWNRSEKVKVTIKGCLHKISVETETISALKKKIETIKEKTAKYHEAAAKAKEQNSIAIARKAEAIEVRKNLNMLAKSDKSKVGRKSANAEFQAEQTRVLEIETAANELVVRARKAVSDEKKARLELEEALAASEQLKKHSLELAIAETNMIQRQKELENREALVQARYAQAAAKNEEAGFIRKGNELAAEKKKQEARKH